MALENLQSNETLVAAIRAGAGDRCALMEKLYNNNVGMISKMANDAACGENLFDDLMQEGYIALENAVKCFDEGHGVKFITYFSTALKWHFRAYKCASDLLVSVPVHLRERLNKCAAVTATLEQEQSEPVTLSQIAERTGLSVAQVAEVQLLSFQLRSISLDAPIADADDLNVGDVVPDAVDVETDVCDNAEREYNKTILHNAMKRSLNDVEQQCVQRYYGGEPLQRVAEDMGLTLQQVYRVHNRSIQNLRRDTQLRVEYLRSCDLYKYSYRRFKDSCLSSVEFIAERNEMLLDKASKTSV